MILSSALIYSTRLPVSVCGTGSNIFKRLADFLGSMVTVRCRVPRRDPVLSGSALCVYFTAHINAYTLQPAIPSAGGTLTAPSPRHSMMEVTEC